MAGMNTPMMKQYMSIKSKYPDAFLFYRVGDFFELFANDAVKGAHILELTLTARNSHSKHPIPMCGIPHLAVDDYVRTLEDKGYKVAICDQLENPDLAKGMVKRGVKREVTPGTYTVTGAENAKNDNFLTAVEYDNKNNCYGFSYIELSTGDIRTSILRNKENVLNELINLQTKEIVFGNSIPHDLLAEIKKVGIVLSKQPYIQPQACPKKLLKRLTIPLERLITKKLLTYIYATQKRKLVHIKPAIPYEPNQYLRLDYNTKYNLELAHNIRNGKKVGTLLWILDDTQTAMGGRKLKRWLNRPLINRTQIVRRQNATEELYLHPNQRNEIRSLLVKVYDLERLATKISYGSVNGRDLIQLKTSLIQIPKIKYILSQLNRAHLGHLYQSLDSVDNVKDLIQKSIQETPPISVTDGGVIKNGYNQKLDKYRDAMKNGKHWMASFQDSERKKTGISNLKIGFNHMLGYYIQVTKANLDKVPYERYQRKQMLKNAERFSTPKLKRYENLLLQAQTKSKILEYKLFVKIRKAIRAQIKRLQKTAEAVSSLDVLQSFATMSNKYRWVKPTLTNSNRVDIIQGRHPVVEKVLGKHKYVPNDIKMDKHNQILLITGSNMSGKSTYMRQMALIVIMAQLGCFVPAKSAVLPIFDQIFTRIGASDNLVAGQSTFMVEMKQANDALQNATKHSLILFDELGRGTSTNDGISLAQAIIEYIHNHVHAMTLFSTHYHELTTLTNQLPNLTNIHIGSREENGRLIFTHRVEPGSEGKSYGIHVAKLAGLPRTILKRANHILNIIESSKSSSQPSYINYSQPNENKLKAPRKMSQGGKQLNLFTSNSHKTLQPNQIPRKVLNVVNHLKHFDLASSSPLKAMNAIDKWQKEMRKNN